MMEKISKDQNEILDLLGDGERSIIYEAQALIRAPMPQDHEMRAYATTNLRIQDDLNMLVGNISVALGRQIGKMRRRETLIRDDLKDEGVKAREERDIAVHGDAQWTDLADQVTVMTALSKRVESLVWNLRNALSIVTR